MLKVTFGAKERWGRGEVIIGTAGKNSHRTRKGRFNQRNLTREIANNLWLEINLLRMYESARSGQFRTEIANTIVLPPKIKCKFEKICSNTASFPENCYPDIKDSNFEVANRSCQTDSGLNFALQFQNCFKVAQTHLMCMAIPTKVD